ncbi:hypothetical protein Pcinc_030275 [Petrolisthes cinctipes]|uniref:Uncharacterized protein n=1 Tax=Petrolisthes cinctipes TaxID=88211 RepID=A0AAE1EYF5_PETCI|nr:hypothetical protein Pcinc_030275 [Petrolisthes cinctipes]
MGVGRVREFIRRNMVMVVMVPVLVGLHYGWHKLQEVEMFVPKEDRRDLPIVQGAKIVGEKLKSKIGIKEEHRMSGVRMESGRVSGVLSHGVQEPAFLSMLGRYRQILSSVYGPKGASILVLTPAGREALVCSSSGIVKQVSFAHPCVKYVNAIISAQNTSCGLNGLYTGLLCVRLLEGSLRCEEDLPHAIVSSVSENIITHLLDLLAHSPGQVVMDLDIGDMNQVVSFVNTILGAKGTLDLTPQLQDALSINIVKAFLKSVPNEYSSEGFGHVAVITQEDSASIESQVFDGVLYCEPDLQHKHIARLQGQSNIKVLLFTVALACTEEDDSVSVRWGGHGTKEENFIHSVLPCLITTMKTRGVHVLANQKPVDPVIKFELERGGYLVLERLGSNTTQALEQVSGCTPVSSLAGLPHQLTSAILGSLTSVELVGFAGRNYVLFDHCEGNVSSLLLPAVSPSVLPALKETVESCLAALRMVVVDGKVVAGGGCLEAWTATRLRAFLTSSTPHLNLTPTITPHHTTKVGSVFVRVLMELALLPSGGLSSRLDWSVDSVFHHLWHTPPVILRDSPTTEDTAAPTNIPTWCVCGLVRRDLVKLKYNGEWLPVEFEVNPIPGTTLTKNVTRRRDKPRRAVVVSGGLRSDNAGDDNSSSSSESDSEELKERRNYDEDSLEGSNSTNQEEEDVDSLEKVVDAQEEEIDSLEGKLDSSDGDGEEEDSLEGILDKTSELGCVGAERDAPPQVHLEGHVMGALYDSFPAKFNALRLALEGFSQLLHIGQCVFDQ